MTKGKLTTEQIAEIQLTRFLKNSLNITGKTKAAKMITKQAAFRPLTH